MATTAFGETVFTAVERRAGDGLSGDKTARKGEPIPRGRHLGESGDGHSQEAFWSSSSHGHSQGCSSAPLPRLCSQGKQKDMGLKPGIRQS